MAYTKIKPSTWFLYIDVAGGTSYSLVVCLNNWAYTQGRSIIDAKSMCGADKSEGTPEYGLTFDGQVIEVPDSGTLGFAAMQAIFTSGVEISWTLKKVTSVTGDLNFVGKGAVSKLDVSADDSNVAKFSSEIAIHGTPTFTVTA